MEVLEPIRAQAVPGVLENAAGQFLQYGLLGALTLLLGWGLWRSVLRIEALQEERIKQARADMATMAEFSKRMAELALAIDTFSRAQELRTQTIERLAQVVEALNRDQETYQERISERLVELRQAVERRGGQ